MTLPLQTIFLLFVAWPWTVCIKRMILLQISSDDRSAKVDTSWKSGQKGNKTYLQSTCIHGVKPRTRNIQFWVCGLWFDRWLGQSKWCNHVNTCTCMYNWHWVFNCYTVYAINVLQIRLFRPWWGEVSAITEEYISFFKPWWDETGATNVW